SVTLVVPYPPGTNADVIARLLTDKLARGLKQTFVVENRPGGATVPATAAVLQAPADGHTLLESGTATNINPLLGVKTAYDADHDLITQDGRAVSRGRSRAGDPTFSRDGTFLVSAGERPHLQHLPIFPAADTRSKGAD